jgi:hypothetical protein
MNEKLFVCGIELSPWEFSHEGCIWFRCGPENSRTDSGFISKVSIFPANPNYPFRSVIFWDELKPLREIKDEMFQFEINETDEAAMKKVDQFLMRSEKLLSFL